MNTTDLEEERKVLLKQHGEIELEFYTLRAHLGEFKTRVINWARKYKDSNPDATTKDIDELVEKWSTTLLELDDEPSTIN